MINTGNNNVLDKNTTEENASEVYENHSYIDNSNNYTETEMNGYETVENVTTEREDKKEENSDTMPSASTMQWLHQYVEPADSEEDEDLVSSHKSYKISPRGKVMMTVYAIVVATIVALIAINAKIIKNMESAIKEKQASIQVLMDETRELENELGVVSSEEVISQKAEELGMSKE